MIRYSVTIGCIGCLAVFGCAGAASQSDDNLPPTTTASPTVSRIFGVLFTLFRLRPAFPVCAPVREQRSQPF